MHISRKENTLLLDGLNAIVTGGSGGIGKAIVQELHQAGAKVIIHYKANRELAETMAASLSKGGATVHALQADLSQEEDCSRLFEQCQASIGTANILVNNAGIQPVVSFGEIDGNEMSEMMQTNVAGPFRLIQLFAEQQIDNGHAAVINIGSIEGETPAFGHSHYAISKAALSMLTRSAALELGDKGIRVNSVSPGLIDREGLSEDWPEGVESWQENVPLARLGKAEDVAKAVCFLASDQSSWITGQNLVVDGGMSVCPAW